MILAPKNWRKFQHYGKRRPPWVKIHRELLSDSEYMRLPLASMALAPLLWLLASESQEENGAFKADLPELCFRFPTISQTTIEKGVNGLLESGLFVDASVLLADCVQSASLETENSVSLSGSASDSGTSSEKNGVVTRPDDVPVQVWKDWLAARKLKKLVLTPTAMGRIEREAKKGGITLVAAITLCAERGWGSYTAGWEKAQSLDKSNPNGPKDPRPRLAGSDFGESTSNF